MQAVRVIDRVADMSDWDSRSFADGHVPVWDAESGKFVGAAAESRDKNYHHRQDMPAAVWTITHNLGKFPAVTVLNSAGDEVIGDVNHASDNVLTVTFAAPFGGTATLN